MWKEFKTFIFRGNVMDLAIGVVIATAFTVIVNSLVKDIIMPCVGMFTAGVDFASLKVVLKAGVLDTAGKVVTPEVAIGYGVFINTIIQFVIIALVVFLVVKMINKARASMDARLKKTVEEEPAAAIPADVALLSEIRDLLQNQK